MSLFWPRRLTATGTGRQAHHGRRPRQEFVRDPYETNFQTWREIDAQSTAVFDRRRVAGEHSQS